MDLRGTTAIVTGGARRIGRQIALSLAAAGARVAVHYHCSREDAEATVREARSLGAEALAVQADARDESQVQQMLGQVLEAFSRIDLLVANAGSFRRTPLPAVTQSDWDDLLGSNLDTFFLPVRHLTPILRRQGGGCIIALADVGGIRPWADHAPYCIAKSGVIALVQTLAVELAPAVRVNAIAPGPILFPSDEDSELYQREIERTLLRRAGQPSDVSDAVLFLARNEYVTGAVLPVDGGRLLS